MKHTNSKFVFKTLSVLNNHAVNDKRSIFFNKIILFTYFALCSDDSLLFSLA